MKTGLAEAIKDEGGALVASRDQALAEWGQGGDWESDGNEDIQPSFPTITIVQNTSRMEGADNHVGEFWHSDWEAYTPEVECVGLVKRDTRALFEEGSDKPVCMSADGKVPLANMPLWEKDYVSVRGGASIKVGAAVSECMDCPFGQWINDAPPVCKESFVLLVDRGEGDLAQLRFGGMSIRPYKQFVSRKLAPKKLPLFSHRLVLSTKGQSDAGKKWRELVIEGELMRPTEAQRYNDILRAQRERFEKGITSEGGQVEQWMDGPAIEDVPFE